MQVTESLIYFFVSGLEKGKKGDVISNHKILAKISRPEVAEAFMRPAPEKILNRLLEDDKITEEQASLARQVPLSYDICAEADSGGHTDQGVAMVLLPSIQRLRNDFQREFDYPESIRVGLAGGIGTPQSAASSFVMGADFIMTGSINQCTVEAGISDAAKDMLEIINVQVVLGINSGLASLLIVQTVQERLLQMEMLRVVDQTQRQLVHLLQ